MCACVLASVSASATTRKRKWKETEREKCALLCCCFNCRHHISPSSPSNDDGDGDSRSLKTMHTRCSALLCSALVSRRQLLSLRTWLFLSSLLFSLPPSSLSFNFFNFCEMECNTGGCASASTTAAAAANVCVFILYFILFTLVVPSDNGRRTEGPSVPSFCQEGGTRGPALMLVRPSCAQL